MAAATRSPCPASRGSERHLWVWRADNPSAPKLGWFNGRQVADADEHADLFDDIAKAQVIAHSGKSDLPMVMQNRFEDGKDANLGHKGVIW